MLLALCGWHHRTVFLLLKELLIDLLHIKYLLDPTPYVKTDHELRQLSSINEHNPFTQELGGFPSAFALQQFLAAPIPVLVVSGGGFCEPY